MPKNKGKGGKNRRRGKNEATTEKGDLLFKEEGQEYAQVVKILGNGYIEAMCFDGVKRLCHIRGKMRKKVWVNHSDIVLVGLRDFQKDRADVIHKYTAVEAKQLKNRKVIPESVKLLEGNAGDLNNADDDEDVIFDYNAETNVEEERGPRDFFAGLSDDDEDDDEFEYEDDNDDGDKALKTNNPE